MKVLSAEQVTEIRQAYRAGRSMRDLAALFGVRYTTVQKIVSGKRWATTRPALITQPRKAWSTAEIEYLVNHWDDPVVDQAEALGRSQSAIMTRRSRL